MPANLKVMIVLEGWNCLSLLSGMISRRKCNRQSMSTKRALLACPPVLGFGVLAGGNRLCELPIKGFFRLVGTAFKRGIVRVLPGGRGSASNRCGLVTVSGTRA